MEHDGLHVASEPRRLQILQLVWDAEMSAGDIAALLPVSFAAVSQHLRKLREAGLVEVRREGRHRYYRARKREMGSLAPLLEAVWSDRLEVLKRMAETARRKGDEER